MRVAVVAVLLLLIVAGLGGVEGASGGCGSATTECDGDPACQGDKFREKAAQARADGDDEKAAKFDAKADAMDKKGTCRDGGGSGDDPTDEPEPEPRPWYPNDGASEIIHMELLGHDGHMIPVTVFRPLIADNATQFPIIIQSHGFTGSRMQSASAAAPYIAAGFGLVSFDERGHGDARDDSDVRFMNPDYEVMDVLRIMDEIATWDWVLLDAPGDPVIGGIGGSYGGAFQMVTAGVEQFRQGATRFDAMVPEITWHNVVQSLAPNGAVKSGWVDLFYAAGNAQGSVVFSDDFHAGWLYANAANEFPAGQYPGIPDLEGEMLRSGPHYYDAVAIPTLYIQGMPDSLFPLNEAVANYERTLATGAHTALYTHNGGHVLNGQSLASSSAPAAGGLQGVPGGSPCGDLVDLNIAWHQTHLLGLDAWAGPDVCIAYEDDSVVTGDTFPLVDAGPVSLGGVWPVPQTIVGSSIGIPIASGTMDLAGVPTLDGTITATGVDNIVYFSLRVPGRDLPYETYVHDQVVPLRIAGPVFDEPFSIDLGGVATHIGALESLELHASAWEPMYAVNSARTPGAVVLGDLEIGLPIV